MTTRPETALKRRIKKIEKMPNETLFYFASYGYVGNDIVLSREGNCGYTTDVGKAQLYTKEETLAQLKLDRAQDKFIPESNAKKYFQTKTTIVDLPLKFKI